MIKYKIDVIKALEEIKINTTVARKSGIFAQDTMRKFRKGDTRISLDILNRLCCLLKMQPGEIVEYSETAEDQEKIITKMCD